MARLTLREILAGQAAQPYEFSAARIVLELPWCWPVDSALIIAARKLFGCEQPRALVPGESCLVSVEGDRAALWIWTRAWKGLFHVQLADDDAHTELNAWNQARRCTPLIAVPGLLSPRPPDFRALKIESRGSGREERILKGESFGLALGLSYVSLLLDLPIAPDVVALAGLDERGATCKVGGLEQKLSVVDAFALGVTRILVHPDQETDARRWSATALPVPVRSLRDAIAVVWPDAKETIRARWREQTVAARISTQLYRIALGNSREVLDWRPIVVSGMLLHERFGDDAIEGRKTLFTTETAKRHIGPIDRPPAWEELAPLRALPASDWLQTVAHYVQGWADSGAPAEDCVAASELAMQEVGPPAQRHPPHLMLLGAIGRALAAAGNTVRAVEVLREAVAGWRALEDHDQASVPLCELIRLLGISGSVSELEATIADEVAWVRSPYAKLSDVSATFIAFAVGRALINAGEPERGIADLTADVPWHVALSHVRTSRLRWLAKAAAQVGRLREADERRRELVEEDELDINVELTRIDVALEANNDPAPILALLKSGPEGWEFQRLEADAVRRSGRELAPCDLARYFSDRYRY